MPDPDDVELRLSGDYGVGQYVPPEFHLAEFERIPADLLEGLRNTTGLVSTASDVLEELGWRLAIPATELSPRHQSQAPVVGQAITIRYLPCRRQAARWQESVSKLAHHVAVGTAHEGDVLVVEVAGLRGVSVFGGLAAQAVKAAGLSGVIIDGGIRDIDQVSMVDLPVWTRYLTPISGKYRAEATGVNVNVSVGTVQVQPGDLVLADPTGMCFIPLESFSEIAERVLAVSQEETRAISGDRPDR